MTNDDIPNQTSPLYHVQPTSHTSEKRIFPSLPYTSENLKFINKFNFQFFDLTDTEYITLCNMLSKYKTCYATQKNDVGKISTPFSIRLKPNAQLMTQRPSKVPIHLRDKLNALLKELEKYNIIKQIGSSPQDKPVYGTTSLNPLIIIPKGDAIKCVIMLDILTQIQNIPMNLGLLNLSLHNQHAQTKSTNLQLILCMPMHIHPLMKTLLNLPVSPQELYFLLSSRVFMVSKDSQISLQNKCLPSLKLL